MVWLTLYKKELLSFWRSSKWIWLPVSFVLLAVTQPISMYYLPEILNVAGGLPEGAMIEIPTPEGAEVMAGVLSQFNTVGIVIIIAAVMGIVNGERQRGTITLIMSRPVSAIQFITSKWVAEVSLLFFSLFLSFTIAAYYTNLLFSHVSLKVLLESFFLYFLWVCFIVTVTLLCSVLFKSHGAVIGGAIGLIAILYIISSFFEEFMKWSPSLLFDQATTLLVIGDASDYFLFNLVCSVLLTIILLLVATFVFQKQERY